MIRPQQYRADPGGSDAIFYLEATKAMKCWKKILAFFIGHSLAIGQKEAPFTCIS